MEFFKKNINIRSSQGGFTLIGVLVASVIGLIVMAGMASMLVGVSTNMKTIENRAKRLVLDEVLKKSFWKIAKALFCHTARI